MTGLYRGAALLLNRLQQFDFTPPQFDAENMAGEAHRVTQDVSACLLCFRREFLIFRGSSDGSYRLEQLHEG